MVTLIANSCVSYGLSKFGWAIQTDVSGMVCLGGIMPMGVDGPSGLDLPPPLLIKSADIMHTESASAKPVPLIAFK
jgi:hypothetical protein